MLQLLTLSTSLAVDVDVNVASDDQIRPIFIFVANLLVKVVLLCRNT